jgi:outer membrane protein TolC
MRFVMNDRIHALFLGSLLIALSPAAPAAAAERVRPISEAQAVAMAVARNPDLRIALLALRQAEQDVIAEEDRYAPILQLDGGVTHTESPSLSSQGGVTTSGSDAVVFGQQISKTFPWGTGVSFRLEEARTSRSAQAFTGSQNEVTLGPGYSILGRLAVVQPLLRGLGTDVGEAQLRAAMFSRTAAEHARDRAASELLRGVLNAYWELWFAGSAYDIERTARALADRQLDDAKARIERGAGAPVDVYTFEGRVAELDEAVLTAQVERKRRAMDLARLLGTIGASATTWTASAGGVPEPPPTPSEQASVKRALEESPEIHELLARRALARDRVKSAGDPDRARLDLEGYLQAEGLGNNEVVPALEQFGTLGAVSAHVGLVFELPLFSDRHDAAVSAADLEADIASEQLRSARDRIESQVRLALLQERTARSRLDLADRTLRLREQQLDATRKRFAMGDAIPLEVLEAEESVRRARLRLTRARVDVALAELERAHLTGALLVRYRKLVAAPKQSPAGWIASERALF